MVFSSPFFLFLFLPIVLLVNPFLPIKIRNLFLLAASLFFYAWGEVEYSLVMVGSIGLNFMAGIMIGRSPSAAEKKMWLAMAVVANLTALLFFKYANFLIDNINVLAHALGTGSIANEPVHLPIGISFFTFQAISYLVDVYRNEVPVQKNPIDLALYISLFPQLIAGPIVRYHDVALQLTQKNASWTKFSSGLERFILGLAKKVLLANSFGYVADEVFAVPQADFSTPLAWIGIVSYAFQIYFDFSGYSDMAIGLGRMLGFEFLENFNHPYAAKSIQDFWRRWHISLSTWFRDYLYIPLGGNRVSTKRLYFNLYFVFFMTGLWHGASWNFIIWGLFHGSFLAFERSKGSAWLAKLPTVLKHTYVMLVVLIAWVFFRAETLPKAFGYLKFMFNFDFSAAGSAHAAYFITPEMALVLIGGVLFALPTKEWLMQKLPILQPSSVAHWVWQLVLVGLFIGSLAYLAAGTYNPFIYFRF